MDEIERGDRDGDDGRREKLIRLLGERTKKKVKKEIKKGGGKKVTKNPRERWKESRKKNVGWLANNVLK